jgi:diguanylate cyclase (GGDEF)-like protein
MLERIAQATGNVVLSGTGVSVGHLPATAATRRIAVVGHDGPLGSVLMVLPLDRALVRRLERRAGIPTGDHVAIVSRNRAVAADAALSGRLPQRPGQASVVHIGGRQYRALAAGLPGAPSSLLALITADDAASAFGGTATKRLLAALIAMLLLAALVAYLEGRAIVRTIRSLVLAADRIARGRLEQRVEVRGRDELAMLGRAFNTMAEQLAARLAELGAERARLREVVSEFGAALAATHDVDELLRVVVEAAVEATGASGGAFAGVDGTFVECGDCEAEGERVELSLDGAGARFGVLTLVGTRFQHEDVETASSLVAQAVVALENARLHSIVARQAMTDGLTGLANRRQCDEALTSEIARVSRFGGSFAVVLADLDGFKDLNDTHGHATGDAVLREVGALLQRTLRASDLAGRWGGEEFLLLLRETSLRGALELAERVRSALEACTILAVDGTPLHVTASFGVGVFDADEDADVVAAADAALYVAKRGGKNRVAPLIREVQPLAPGG